MLILYLLLENILLLAIAWHLSKFIQIKFDRDYGIDKRTGWSIVIFGRVEPQLEANLFVAIAKAVRSLSLWDRDILIDEIKGIFKFR